MPDELKKIKELAQKKISACGSLDQLKLIQSQLTGKNSQLSSIIADVANMPLEDRKSIGKVANLLKKEIELLLNSRKDEMIVNKKNKLGYFDLTKPGQYTKMGHLHPVTQIVSETYDIFTRLGFAIVDGPEIESDWYNFEALNIPPDHPARDMQDTFYLDKKLDDTNLVARTQTSAMQVRFIEKNKPPFKIIVPGKVFRNENEDATHSWIFTQIEGLVVGKSISISDLKGTLTKAITEILGEDTEIRFRPSYFPYTEPSIEIDARWKGKWLELAGAGMVHPEVLKKGGIDPKIYNGFAFGWGADRLAVIKYGVQDLRMFWRPKFKYLEQF